MQNKGITLNVQVCISLTFPLFAMLFTISFDVLSGYVIKLDYSFRFLNFDKFCDTAPHRAVNDLLY